MFVSFLILVLGLALLIGGGDTLVRGASALARILGLSPLFIGLTVVALGTSAPELAVNLLAAFRGVSDISYGNIVGSNIANVALILGCTALLAPIGVHRNVVIREIPMMLLASAAFAVMALDSLLDGRTSEIGRGDGFLLLLFLSVFLYYTLREAWRSNDRDAAALGIHPIIPIETHQSAVRAGLLTLAGLAGVVLGGQFTVDGAVRIAEGFGISQTVIGLTLVAGGTSLPELVTSLIAAKRGQSDIAVGNVVGSNILNILLILGLTSIVKPVPIPIGGYADLGVMCGFALILLPLSISNRFRITRMEGLALLVLYIVYISWRAWTGQMGPSLV